MMIGQTISHYEIIQKLGGGGMGVVYKARDTQLDRYVALKFLPPQLTKDNDAKERLIHEARAASSLDHPNICTIYEISETKDGQLFICMAHYDGQTLEKLIDDHPLRVENAVDIAMQVGQGLAKAHKQGIVHRDIKPANVIITPEGVAKIVDFGLAKISDAPLTKIAGVMGTATYMAPEQINGSKGDERTDIWALGVILYEMLAGRVPFQGAYSQAVMYAILNAEPEPVQSVRSGIPDELSHIVHTALQKNPVHRYHHMEDLINELWSLTQQFDLSLIKKKQIQGVGAPIALAVLPFFNLRMDPEQEYFCEGFSQDIRNTLARLSGLTVTPHSIVMDARERHEDIREVGKELKAETLLEGAVRKTDDHIKITAQLINVIDGNHLWAERYDRKAEEILQMKEEICSAIIDQLNLDVDETERKKVTRNPTQSIQAYDAYLHGLYHSQLYRKESLFESVFYFQYAVQTDPTFAGAYTALAKSLFWLGSGHFDIPTIEMLPDASKALSAASEIGESSAEALAVAASIAHRFQNDWVKAENLFLQALKSDPGNPFTHQNYALYLVCVNRWTEALDHSETAREQNPRGFLTNLYAGLIRYYFSDFDVAIERLNDAREANPDYAGIYTLIGYANIGAKRYEQAIRTFNQALDHSKRPGYCLVGKAYGLSMAGDFDAAESILKELDDRLKTEYITPVGIAGVYAGLGQMDKTKQYLLQGKEQKDCWLSFAGVDPVFKDLRTDAGFQEFLKTVLPQFPHKPSTVRTE